jgi:hypothetical protein
VSNPTALVQKLWNYCNILRDDGLSYGDYVEQLTFLLFLKTADEQSCPPFDHLVAKEKEPSVSRVPSQTAHAAIFRVPRKDDCVVACLARPFAHVLNPEICSAINLDSGTNSVST